MKMYAKAVILLTGMLVLTGCASGGSVTEDKDQTVSTGGGATMTAMAKSVSTDASEVTMTADMITVTAKSSVFSVPDKAEISVGTNTNGATAAEAQDKSAEKTNAVIDKLKEMGIEDKSIKTTNYNMYQRYDNNGKPNGYEVDVMLSVKDQDIDAVGDLIAALTNAGADRFHGVSFYCSTYDDDYNEAMGAALSEARKKADVLAGAAGRTISGIRSIQEGYQDTSYEYSSSFGAAYDSAESAKSMAMMPGEAEISARITVTYYME